MAQYQIYTGGTVLGGLKPTGKPGLAEEFDRGANNARAAEQQRMKLQQDKEKAAREEEVRRRLAGLSDLPWNGGLPTSDVALPNVKAEPPSKSPRAFAYGDMPSGAPAAQYVPEAGKAPVVTATEVKTGIPEIDAQLARAQQNYTNPQGSTVRTESGGNFRARNDVEGHGGHRGHFGRLQWGQSRVNDAIAAGVLPAGTKAADLVNGTPEAEALQKTLEAWSAKDLAQFVADNGLYRYIGTVINDVPVTATGMLKVAHLGGKEGLRRFLTSNGRYNPSDKKGPKADEGTRLIDYLFDGYVEEATQAPQAAQAGIDPSRFFLPPRVIDTPSEQAAAMQLARGRSTAPQAKEPTFSSRTADTVTQIAGAVSDIVSPTVDGMRESVAADKAAKLKDLRQTVSSGKYDTAYSGPANAAVREKAEAWFASPEAEAWFASSMPFGPNSLATAANDPVAFYLRVASGAEQPKPVPAAPSLTDAQKQTVTGAESLQLGPAATAPTPDTRSGTTPPGAGSVGIVEPGGAPQPVPGQPAGLAYRPNPNMYLGDPQQMTQQMQLLRMQDDELRRMQEIYALQGDTQAVMGLRQKRLELRAQDNALQFEQSLHLFDMGDPRALAGTWSRMTGADIQFRPNFNGTYDVLANGSVWMPQGTPAQIRSAARMTLDSVYRQQAIEADKMFLEHNLNQQKEELKGLLTFYTEKYKADSTRALEAAKILVEQMGFVTEKLQTSTGEELVIKRKDGQVMYRYNPEAENALGPDYPTEGRVTEVPMPGLRVPATQ